MSSKQISIPTTIICHLEKRASYSFMLPNKMVSWKFGVYFRFDTMSNYQPSGMLSSPDRTDHFLLNTNRHRGM